MHSAIFEGSHEGLRLKNVFSAVVKLAMGFMKGKHFQLPATGGERRRPSQVRRGNVSARFVAGSIVGGVSTIPQCWRFRACVTASVGIDIFAVAFSFPYENGLNCLMFTEPSNTTSNIKKICICNIHSKTRTTNSIVYNLAWNGELAILSVELGEGHCRRTRSETSRWPRSRWFLC